MMIVQRKVQTTKVILYTHVSIFSSFDIIKDLFEITFSAPLINAQLFLLIQRNVFGYGKKDTPYAIKYFYQIHYSQNSISFNWNDPFFFSPKICLRQLSHQKYFENLE